MQGVPLLLKVRMYSLQSVKECTALCCEEQSQAQGEGESGSGTAIHALLSYFTYTTKLVHIHY